MSVVFCAVTAAIVAAVAITASNAATCFRLSAFIRICAVNFQLVLVYMLSVWMMQVTVVQVVYMVVMLDRSMLAIFAVCMGVITVSIAAHIVAPY